MVALPYRLAPLRASLRDSGNIEGLTHGFYHYPARFSPAVARAAIELFSSQDDWILDPFMGGGTAVVEALALGRRVIGVDINPLAHFVANVRTTPMSASDEEAIRDWAVSAADVLRGSFVDFAQPTGVPNMPGSLGRFMSAALELVEALDRERQRAFARCVLLRLGQWAMDCREWKTPRRARLAEQLEKLTLNMLDGLDSLVMASCATGIPKGDVVSRRKLFRCSAEEIGVGALADSDTERPRMVITSPPYPGVHVLYHRWQYRGRKETPAPYWIAGVPDGHPESYYTAGSRTPTGLNNYFDTIERVFASVHALLQPGSVVVQLVGFSDVTSQLRRYARAMERAGFEPIRMASGRAVRMARRVYNRKWYHRIRSEVSGGSERLLLHHRL